MRFLGRSLIALFLLVVTVGLLAWAGNTIRVELQARWAEEDRVRPARERVFSVNVVTAEPDLVTPELRVYGEVRSVRQLELRVPVGGTVVELAPGFQDGGMVSEGQLLLRIDPAEAEAALRTTRTDLRTAQADLREAEADARDADRLLELAVEEVAAAQGQADLRQTALTRQQDLLGRGVGSAAAVETAELALSTAGQTVLARRQALANAEARVELAATDLDRQGIALERRQIAVEEAERILAETKVYADFTGTLSEVSVLEGGLVSPNERIATVIDNTALEVAIRLSTTQHARLLDDTGQLLKAPVTIVLDVLGLDVTASGQLVREAPSVGEGQTGRLVFASLQDAKGFRPGDFVEARIEEPALRFATRLPATALDAQSEVLVIGPEDRLEEIAVTLLRRQGDDVLVRSRDIAGRQVVAERTPLLGAGIKVRALSPNTEIPEAPATIALDPERRARLIAFVEGNTRMPADVRERLLSRLNQDEVPAATVERLESRMGG